MHAILQSPRVWNTIQTMNFWTPTVSLRDLWLNLNLNLSPSPKSNMASLPSWHLASSFVGSTGELSKLPIWKMGACSLEPWGHELSLPTIALHGWGPDEPWLWDSRPSLGTLQFWAQSPSPKGGSKKGDPEKQLMFKWYKHDLPVTFRLSYGRIIDHLKVSVYILPTNHLKVTGKSLSDHLTSVVFFGRISLFGSPFGGRRLKATTVAAGRASQLVHGHAQFPWFQFVRFQNNGGSQILEPLLIFTSACPLKAQISQWLGPFFQTELFKTGHTASF